MAIQRKPTSVGAKSEAAAAAFVDGAPDARKPAASEAVGTYEKGVAKGNKRQISLTIAPELLRKVDELAKRSGQARAAIINLALYRLVERDDVFDRK